MSFSWICSGCAAVFSTIFAHNRHTSKGKSCKGAYATQAWVPEKAVAASGAVVADIMVASESSESASLDSDEQQNGDADNEFVHSDGENAQTAAEYYKEVMKNDYSAALGIYLIQTGAKEKPGTKLLRLLKHFGKGVEIQNMKGLKREVKEAGVRGGLPGFKTVDLFDGETDKLLFGTKCKMSLVYRNVVDFVVYLMSKKRRKREVVYNKSTYGE